MTTSHHRRLERMYLAAPCNARYHDLTMRIAASSAVVGFAVTPDLHHAAGAVHGSQYFKLLDDAAFFAVASLVEEVFVLTVSFTVQLMRPVVAGRVEARGAVIKPGKRLFFAESVLRDAADRELARGSGVFAPSDVALASIPTYADPLPAA